MVTCESCSASLQSGDAFCPSCGTAIVDESVTADIHDTAIPGALPSITGKLAWGIEGLVVINLLLADRTPGFQRTGYSDGTVPWLGVSALAIAALLVIATAVPRSLSRLPEPLRPYLTYTRVAIMPLGVWIAWFLAQVALAAIAGNLSSFIDYALNIWVQFWSLNYPIDTLSTVATTGLVAAIAVIALRELPQDPSPGKDRSASAESSNSRQGGARRIAGDPKRWLHAGSFAIAGLFLLVSNSVTGQAAPAVGLLLIAYSGWIAFGKWYVWLNAFYVVPVAGAIFLFSGS